MLPRHTKSTFVGGLGAAEVGAVGAVEGPRVDGVVEGVGWAGVERVVTIAVGWLPYTGSEGLACSVCVLGAVLDRTVEWRRTGWRSEDVELKLVKWSSVRSKRANQRRRIDLSRGFAHATIWAFAP